MAEKASSERTGSRYSGPLADCDVHHTWPSQQALLEYFSEGWREYIMGPGREGQIPLAAGFGYHNPHGLMREDAFPESGPPGSDYELLRDQLLDPYNIRRAVLTYGEGLFTICRLPNPYLAAEYARAANDWTIDTWLSRDKRLVGSILVPFQLPDLAVDEIRRVGGHGQMGQVIMAAGGIGQPLGHPLFHPIYAAATEFNLPVALHVGGTGENSAHAAGGLPTFYIDQHVLCSQPIMTHLVSFIVNGVFEKFPTLKLALLEAGVAWVPHILWRLDVDYKGCRREIPWVKRLPSEYFYDRIRLTTQPLELSPTPEQLIHVMECFRGEDTLLFATDYPHWDSDDVDYVATRLPGTWLPKIYYENARAFYGWPSDDGRDLRGQRPEAREAPRPVQPEARHERFISGNVV